MSIQTFNINPRQVGTGGFTSPGFTIPTGLNSITIQVASPDWDTTTGFVTLQFQVFKDGVWVETGSTTMTMGGRAKDGTTMPSYRAGASTFDGATQVRLFVSCNPQIRIGGTISVETLP